LSLTMEIPALIKVLGVFALILFLNRLRLALSLSLFLGSLALGWGMAMDLEGLWRSVLRSLTQVQTISLFLIVGSILIISRLMQESGHLNRIVAGFSRLSGDERSAGLVLPALIGLLPMPGGALFSAPMVESTFRRHGLSGEEQTAVNYWFRHIWEYWWPLYPAVVLAVALLQVKTWQFILVMAPMTAVMILAGIIFILKPIPSKAQARERTISRADLMGFLWEIMPILIVVLVIILLEGSAGLLKPLGIASGLPPALSILPGLWVSLLWVRRVNRIPFHRVREAVWNRGILSILLLVAAIMIFQGIMKDSRAVSEIRSELLASRIPILLVVVLMPFLSGLITGIGIGFVGTAFPLIIPLFPAGSTWDFLSYAALAYVLGFTGMMLSPVHLCFLVTKDYFRAGLLASYRRFYKPLLAVAGTAAALFSLSRLW